MLTILCLAAGMREHPPIAVCDLAEHIERLKANDGLCFSQEYEVSAAALIYGFQAEQHTFSSAALQHCTKV